MTNEERRKAAEWCRNRAKNCPMTAARRMYEIATEALEEPQEALPSAQPEVRPIDYKDCSNAMLKMWMDNVVTDGEYNRIMDKLNAHWGKRDG